MGTRHAFVSAPCHDITKRQAVEKELIRALETGEVIDFRIMDIKRGDGSINYFIFAGATAKEMHNGMPEWIICQALGIDIVWISDEWSYGLDPVDIWPM